jgi:autotransporter-associated beta strand protein
VSRARLRCLVLLALVGGWSAAADAQTFVTWDGGGANNNWTTGTNWIGDTAPVSGNALTFTGLVQQSTNNDFAASTSFDRIVLSQGGFTLAGNALRLSRNDIDVDNTGNNTISMALAPDGGGGVYFYGRQSGTLTVSGSIDSALGITVNSDNSNGSMVFSGKVHGTGGIECWLTGATLTLANDNTGFSGAVGINRGTVRLDDAGGLGSTAAGVILRRYAQFNAFGTLDLNGKAVGAEPITFARGGGDTTSGTGGLLSNSSASDASLSGAVSMSVGGIFGGAGNMSLSGVISGTGSLNKVDAGMVTLANAGDNTYTGSTIISGGTLSISRDGHLGAAPGAATADAIQMTNGSTLRTSASLGLAANRGVTLGTGGGRFDVTSGTLGVAGAVSGTGALTKLGSGTLTLSASNSYGGGTTLNAGTLLLGGSNSLGSSSGALTVNGGTLDLGGATMSVGTLSGTGGTIALGGGGLTTTMTSNQTFSGAIGGTGGFTKGGGSVLTLAGQSTYTGLTTVSEGTLQIGSGGTAGLLGSGTVALASTGNIVFNRSDALTVNNTFTWSGTSNAGGSITHSGAGTLALQGNQSACAVQTTAGAGAVTVSGGTLTLGNASGAQFQSRLEPAAGTTITVTSAVAPAAAEGAIGFLYVGRVGAAGGIVSLGNASAVTYGSIVTNVGTLDIVGTLESTLKGKRLVFENNLAGASVLQLSGSLTSPIGTGSGNLQVSAGADAGFAARTAPATINIGGSGAALTYGQSSFLNSGRTLYFGSPTADNVVTFVNGLDLAGATQTVNVVDNAGSAGDAAVLTGVLSNGGLTKTGAGRLSLAADNTYTGLTTISAGTLSIGSGGTAGAVAGGILNNAALVFDRSNALVFSGTIGGSGGLTKQGGGTLTLAGTSSYAGTTNVDVGGLLVDGALSGVGLASVASGARVGGDGSLAGALSLLSGARFIFNPSATLDVAGAVTLDNSFGVSSLVAADGSAVDWASIATGTYTLIGTSSTFNNISDFGVGNAVAIDAGRTAYFQNGSLQLVIVPEPGAFALAGLGIAAAAWASRRRR